MKTRVYLFLAVLLVPLPRESVAAESADLFKEAQLEETTARDMESAAKLYQDFLKQPHTDRSLQAQALLHLGLCESKMGKTDAAKAAWKKIVQDYSDQTESYSQALNQLQQLQIAERAEVHISSPIIKEVKVYESPPPGWMVEFPRGMFLHTMDGKGRLIETAAGGSIGFVRFVQPNSAVGMELGNLGSSGPPSARRDIGYFLIMARLEKPIVSGLTGYLKAGPGMYLFKFSNSQTTSSKLNIGGTLEAGFAIGLPRGFDFNVGYLIHTFAQSTPSQSFDNTIPSSDQSQAAPITQNRGLRLVGGPAVSLSLRW